MSTPIRSQALDIRRGILGYPRLTVTIRHDDSCGNGHNTFSITGVYRYGSGGYTAGCIHEEIGEFFPELKYLIKWHNCSTDGPLHYIENTMFLSTAGDLEAARVAAIWPDATLEQLQDVETLQERLPRLMKQFQDDVEALGFTY